MATTSAGAAIIPDQPAPPENRLGDIPWPQETRAEWLGFRIEPSDLLSNTRWGSEPLLTGGDENYDQFNFHSGLAYDWWSFRLASTVRFPCDLRANYFALCYDPYAQPDLMAPPTIFKRIEPMILRLPAGKTEGTTTPVWPGPSDSGSYRAIMVPEDQLPGLLRVELYSDLNNDGTLTSADSGLTGSPYASGATDEQKDKGTEFIFLNDDLSNGAWDRNDSKTPSDGKPSDPDDDDAEEIVIKFTASQGELWLEHPAIDSIKFYDNAKCTGTEVPLKSGNRLNLASRAIPEHVFMRVDTEVSGHQSAGDLVLKYAPTAGGTAIDAAKMRLVVVDDIRAEKHHRAVVDYIREKNTKHYLNWVDRTKADSVYVGYLAKSTNMDGIDPRGGLGWLGGGIHYIQEAMSLGADAVVVGNYAGGHTYPIIGDNYWPTFQDGEIYESGTWNQQTSHTAAKSRVGYWRTSLTGGGFTHETMFGDIPAATTSGGMAGLVHEPIGNDDGMSAMGRADVSAEDTVIYLNSGYSSRQLGIFEAALKVGIVPPLHPNSDGWAFRQFDGGNSTALAIASPYGTMFLPTKHGGRHQPGTPGYVAFETAGDLVGAYIRMDPQRPRVPTP